MNASAVAFPIASFSFKSLFSFVFRIFIYLAEFNPHNQINRIEVFFAVKAACQVCFRISSRMEIMAARTAEAKQFTAAMQVQIEQICNDFVDGDMVADFV